MRCPSCAEEIPSDARFCPFCGHHAGASGSPEDPTVAQTPTDADATTRIERDATTPADPDATTRIEPAPTGPTRACPRCDAPNSAQRGSCGRCGADLETGTQVVRDPMSDVDPEDYEDEGAGARGWSGRRVAVVLLLAALIGAAVGLVLWLGGEDEPPPQERAVFDEGVYPEDPVELAVRSIDASSARTVDDELMSADHLLDRDPSNAWVAEGGEGETLAIRFESAVWIGAVSVWNGDQSDDERFAGYGRARRLLIGAEDGTTIEVVLADDGGEQSAELPDPVLVRTITVEVVEVTDEGEDVALSGLEFRGWEARGVDRAR